MYIIITLALSVLKNIRILNLNSSRIYYNKEKLILNIIFRKENTIFNILKKASLGFSILEILKKGRIYSFYY